MSGGPCLEAFAAILALLAATGGAVALLGARRAKRHRRQAFARANRPTQLLPNRIQGHNFADVPRSPDCDDDEPQTVVLPPRETGVRFAPDVRTVSPDAETNPHPMPAPAKTLATVKGDAFDRAIEEERRALRHRKDRS